MGPLLSSYLVWLMLVLTVVSGVDYFVHARQRIQENQRQVDVEVPRHPGDAGGKE